MRICSFRFIFCQSAFTLCSSACYTLPQPLRKTLNLFPSAVTAMPDWCNQLHPADLWCQQGQLSFQQVKESFPTSHLSRSPMWCNRRYTLQNYFKCSSNVPLPFQDAHHILEKNRKKKKRSTHTWIGLLTGDYCFICKSSTLSFNLDLVCFFFFFLSSREFDCKRSK